MGHGDYEKLTPETIDAVWVRLCAGQAAKPTARQLGLSPSTVRAYLLRCGGVRPDPRRRAQCRGDDGGAGGDQSRLGGWAVDSRDRGPAG